LIGQIKSVKDDHLILEIQPQKLKANEIEEKTIPLNQIAQAKILF
jgi:hypothetical protein